MTVNQASNARWTAVLAGMSIAFGGLMGSAGTIAVDREDGTLLRSKATPNGMLGYLVGKIAMFSITMLISLAMLAIPGYLVAGDLVFNTRTWLLLILIFVFGMVSTVPISVSFGSLLKSSAETGFIFLASILLVIPSGIFYPITAMPAWLQWVGQTFPFYWFGLGARSAMLPGSMAAVEIGGSWRTLEMFAVLAAWTAIGMVFAPILLRRMARRQSGSAVAQARERIMSKGY
jgi:ABC-2 type transport system permease protein